MTFGYRMMCYREGDLDAKRRRMAAELLLMVSEPDHLLMASWISQLKSMSFERTMGTNLRLHLLLYRTMHVQGLVEMGVNRARDQVRDRVQDRAGEGSPQLLQILKMMKWLLTASS